VEKKRKDSSHEKGKPRFPDGSRATGETISLEEKRLVGVRDFLEGILQKGGVPQREKRRCLSQAMGGEPVLQRGEPLRRKTT